MIRLLTFIGGLAGAVSLSQFPEFSQQYLQRLGGQVDALALVTQDFDMSATKAGMDREAALEALNGSEFLTRRQQDMRTTFARYERLSRDLDQLQNAGPIERLTMPQSFTDGQLLRATWSNYKPAMPVTITGLIISGIGFIIGWALIKVLLSLLYSLLTSKKRLCDN